MSGTFADATIFFIADTVFNSEPFLIKIFWFKSLQQSYSIIYEKALFIEKQYNSLIHSEYFFTGYGLGEYAALFICTDILTIEQIIDLLITLGSILYNNTYYT